MLSWFQALMPKEERFFDLFEAHAKTLCAGARSLRQLLEGGEQVPERCAEIARLEAEADAVTREVLLAVRRTFITPFDRADIRDLISSMDDAIDQMHKTAKAITLFEQRSFAPHMVTLGEVIVKTADLTSEAVPLLRALRGNAQRLNAITEEVTRLEEDSDELFDQGMAALFHGPARGDAMAFIVGSEIYDHLEKVVDRFEDVANRISGVLIEHL
ncbi:MAG: phosphate transport regulator [Phenylobacterium sp.]|nr:phosphate transport regulator [Phenylobacterium sp.]